MHAVETFGAGKMLLPRSILVAFSTEGSALTMMLNPLKNDKPELSMLTAIVVGTPTRPVRTAGVDGQELVSGGAIQTVLTVELPCPLDGRTAEGASSSNPMEKRRSVFSNFLSFKVSDRQIPMNQLRIFHFIP